MNRNPDQALMDEAIRGVVQLAQPQRIILFGSRAQGRIGPHGNLDLLVAGTGCDSLDLNGGTDLDPCCAWPAVDGIGASPDIRLPIRDSYGMVMHEGLGEGRLVYVVD